MEALHPGRHRFHFAITIADREDAVFPSLGWGQLTTHPLPKDAQTSHDVRWVGASLRPLWINDQDIKP
ncbi:protein of unknown function [Acidithiobacillus ferrivorans]|jgi:hypothetical protein|uniref:Uncharacterized protein n=1 Tax=Acidithiobacillus ferrivorans TaxID=160808 RepID=A0A060URX6_9PROT|nr:hypothetical protein AFERRI_30159 [Acidithiobacillus ferrivorans]SMH67241.1 protein of unknown function [Acidithiobacillus ferrivorans]